VKAHREILVLLECPSVHESSWPVHLSEYFLLSWW